MLLDGGGGGRTPSGEKIHFDPLTQKVHNVHKYHFNATL